MGESGKKLLVVQVAGLSAEVARGLDVPGLTFAPIDSVFPAVTCTVQGSFRTAAAPGAHGMIANGLYHRALRRPMFWEQSSALVTGPRIWDEFRADGGRVAMLFWQQSMGEDVDVVLTPAPIHKHHGGMIQDCYCRPAGLYRRLCEMIGRPFDLKQYWGPCASANVGDWITAATASVLECPHLNVDVVLTYLPTLDYDFQRFGPAHAKSLLAAGRLRGQLTTLTEAAKQQEADVLMFGDYAIADATGPVVYPNRALSDAKLFATRNVRGKLYPDFHRSRAFAMVDHEIAHVYVPDADDLADVRAILAELPGVQTVMDRPACEAARVACDNCGELVAVTESGAWCAYPWWTDNKQAPDYARHVDIHNKPGFDPCELFLQWWPPPPGVSTDASRIGGTHGRTGQGRQAAWAANFQVGRGVKDVVDLAAAVREKLNA